MAVLLAVSRNDVLEKTSDTPLHVESQSRTGHDWDILGGGALSLQMVVFE